MCYSFDGLNDGLANFFEELANFFEEPAILLPLTGGEKMPTMLHFAKQFLLASLQEQEFANNFLVNFHTCFSEFERYTLYADCCFGPRAVGFYVHTTVIQIIDVNWVDCNSAFRGN